MNPILIPMALRVQLLGNGDRASRPECAVYLREILEFPSSTTVVSHMWWTAKHLRWSVRSARSPLALTARANELLLQTWTISSRRGSGGAEAESFLAAPLICCLDVIIFAKLRARKVSHVRGKIHQWQYLTNLHILYNLFFFICGIFLGHCWLEFRKSLKTRWYNFIWRLTLAYFSVRVLTTWHICIDWIRTYLIAREGNCIRVLERTVGILNDGFYPAKQKWWMFTQNVL